MFERLWAETVRGSVCTSVVDTTVQRPSTAVRSVFTTHTRILPDTEKYNSYDISGSGPSHPPGTTTLHSAVALLVTASCRHLGGESAGTGRPYVEVKTSGNGRISRRSVALPRRTVTDSCLKGSLAAWVWYLAE
jgi:hypothetical protein